MPSTAARIAVRERRASADSPLMTPAERRATSGLATIYGLRMLGMFIILPVFAIHAETLPGGGDHTLVGIALGAYALTQAALQVPFGWASDRFGRKPAIVAGLIVFALGSFVAAWASDIYWTIVGRAIQGAGAISAAVIALTADLTRDEVRTKAMAAIGMTIGGTFALSLVAGPLLRNAIGVPGIFALTGVLALGAIAVVWRLVPEAAQRSATLREGALRAFRRVLADRELARLNYGIFALHAVLMTLFVQLPFELRDAGLPVESHWSVYLPVLLASIVFLWPALRNADRSELRKPIFIGAVFVLVIAEIVLSLAGARLVALVVGLVAFFTAFNLLEAVLPSLVSKFAPSALRGTAVGLYSSVQFLGTFAGAAVGGALAQHVGPSAVFLFGLALSGVWLLAAVTMGSPPAYHSNPSLGET
ncbi:MAG TPA: MFS transporter [Casimicrobiaceae bacterium]|nr:MFS transporter [Casimicrobiaceae bacterium]